MCSLMVFNNHRWQQHLTTEIKNTEINLKTAGKSWLWFLDLNPFNPFLLYCN